MKVLLSIKPEFANKIFDGSKKFEFRKSVFKNPSVDTVVVYASSPVQKVIGEFKVSEIITDDVERLWQKTAQYSGISKMFYDEYFSQKREANAIAVGRKTKYSEPLSLSDFGIKYPPQSYMYIQ
ncbi:MAG: ASCH domain-containing protein [Paludibacteraceae bacterium]|nr:ASCH domain-containing protein [Paludibacteraceae bacterium]